LLLPILTALPITLAADVKQPINGTIWWRTQGAAVIEPQDRHECMLYVYDARIAIVFNFDKNSLTSVLVSDSIWSHLKQGAAVISFGTQTYTADSAVIAHDSNGIPLVNFTLQSVPPSKTQLIDAQHIQIAAVDPSLPTFDFTLPHAKMPALLTAVTECQQLVSSTPLR
jgi:hypothetical protein